MSPSEEFMIHRRFDFSNPNFYDDVAKNDIFLRSVHNFFSDVLKRKEHVFLNEVFDRLSYPRTQFGQILGWTSQVYLPDHPFYYVQPQSDGTFFLEFKPEGNILMTLAGPSVDVTI